MSDYIMLIVGVVAFSVIGFRVLKMVRRAQKKSKQDRLRAHLDWNNHINEPRRRV
jgi:hypothetical protein